MADNVTLNPGTGGDTVRTKDRVGTETQIVGLDLNIGGAESLMNGVMPVNDNSGSLTVDAPVGTPVFVRLSDGSTAIATLPVSLAALPATAADGAAGLPAVQMVIAGYDGTNVQALITDSTGRLILPPTSQAGATVKTSDYDSGAGTDTVPMQGLALPASGGAVQGGTSTNPVRTDPTGTTTQPVSGTVTASGPLTDTQLRASAVPVDTELPASAALADATANPTVPFVGAGALLFNGTTWDRVRGDTTNGVDVDVTRVQGTVTVDTELPAAAALADATSNPTTPLAGAANLLFNGTTWDRIRGDTTNGVDVDVTRMSALVTGTASIGRVNVEPQTANGLSIFHLVSAATTNATNVKASAGQLYGWYIYNSNAAARKVAFHNTAGTPTAGASVTFSIVIPPTSAANVEYTNGLAFGTGIAITTVTDLTDAGATAVAASDLIINLFYK